MSFYYCFITEHFINYTKSTIASNSCSYNSYNNFCGATEVGANNNLIFVNTYSERNPSQAKAYTKPFPTNYA